MLAHSMLAKIAPEFAIDHTEATALAKAFCNYARHTSYRMDPRTRDLGALILTALAIEGPRLMRVASRRSAQASAAKAQAASMANAGGTVIDLDGARR